MSWELKLDGFRNVVDEYFHVQHIKLGLQLVRALKEFSCSDCKRIPLCEAYLEINI